MAQIPKGRLLVARSMQEEEQEEEENEDKEKEEGVLLFVDWVGPFVCFGAWKSRPDFRSASLLFPISTHFKPS